MNSSIIGKIEKAKRYAAEPERVVICRISRPWGQAEREPSSGNSFVSGRSVLDYVELTLALIWQEGDPPWPARARGPEVPPRPRRLRKPRDFASSSAYPSKEEHDARKVRSATGPDRLARGSAGDRRPACRRSSSKAATSGSSGPCRRSVGTGSRECGALRFCARS